MHYLKVRVNPQKGLYKIVSVACVDISPIKFVKFVINQSENDIFLVNLRYDQTLIIGESQKLLLLKWVHHSPTVTELNENHEFVQTLFDTDFIESFAGIKVFAIERPIHPQLTGKWFTWAKVFIKPVFVLQVMIILSALVAVALSKFTLVPTFSDLFWQNDIVVLYIGSYFLSFLLTCLHEFAHFLIAKAYGIESSISLFSSRMNQLISETQHYYLYTLQKNQRVIIYLSGILFDSTLASVCILLLYCGLIGEEWVAIVRYIIVIEFLNIWWQFSLYFKTDIYNALSDWIGQQNLYEDSLRYLQLFIASHQKLRFALRFVMTFLQVDSYNSRLSSLNHRERSNARSFAILIFIGFLFSVSRQLLVSIPRDFILMQRAVLALDTYPTNAGKLGVLLVIALICSNYLILLLLYVRKLYRGGEIYYGSKEKGN